MKNYWIGPAIFGLLLGWVWTTVFMGIFKDYVPLTSCAKTHNVYQCEMVAVPKRGEK